MSTATESIPMDLVKDKSIDKDNVVVNKDTTVVSTIVDVLEDNEEVEESSIISGFEMSDLQMAELTTVANQVNTICNPTVEVSVSVDSNKALREIAHDIFLTSGQIVNWKMKESVVDWGELKKKVKDLIDDHLKIKMIKQAQKERLCISIQGARRIITSYNEIGKAFKYDSSDENISRITSITGGQFANEPGYQGVIEKEVMRELNLCYPETDKKIMGSISRIVTQRKVEMVSK